MASTTAVGLARGAIYAMTISQWKTIGAAILACVLALGGLRAFAQYAETCVTERPTRTSRSPKIRQAALTRSVAKIRAELDEANRRNAELQKQLQAIQAELKTLRASPTPPPVQEAKPAEGAMAEPTGPSSNVPRAAGPQGRDGPNGSSPNFHYIRSGDLIFMVSLLGDKIKTYSTMTGKTRSVCCPPRRNSRLRSFR